MLASLRLALGRTASAASHQLLPDPAGFVDLPVGFSYGVLQRAGDLLSDGHRMGGQPDGMGCFEGSDGSVVLLRNHELASRSYVESWSGGHFPFESVPTPCEDSDYFGGVCRLVIDRGVLHAGLAAGERDLSRAVTRSNHVLAGTDRNCAGGSLLGGWVSCEESSRAGHGYAFLTLPGDEELVAPRRLTSWGRFHREAVAIDSDTGIIYMTEDRDDGCFYRFVPDGDPTGPGRLQALVIDGVSRTHPILPRPLARRRWEDGHTWSVRWVDVPDPQAEVESCRAQAQALGATTFFHTEGIAAGVDGIWFTASVGGAKHGGQLFRYEDGASPRLTLVLEIVDRGELSAPDNICMSPWGDLIMAEDNYDQRGGVTHQHIRGLTTGGRVYDVARNPNVDRDGGAEFTGVCFSPDGNILFANLQRPVHATLAITGPWEELRA